VYSKCFSDEDQSPASSSDASLGDIVAAEQLVRTAQEERSEHLPIGNLLITAGRDGQVFQVTATWRFSLKPHACSKSRKSSILQGFRARDPFGGESRDLEPFTPN